MRGRGVRCLWAADLQVGNEGTLLLGEGTGPGVLRQDGRNHVEELLRLSRSGLVVVRHLRKR